MAKKKEDLKEEVPIEEEETTEESTEGKNWEEEFTVAGEELLGFVKKMAHEATVRQLTIRNEDHGVNLHIPLAIGVVGIALFPFYAAIGLIAALVTDCTVTVERYEKEKAPEDTAEPEAA